MSQQKLMNALYPVTSLARLCGLLPIQIHGTSCSLSAGATTQHNHNINRVKTFDNTNDDVTNQNGGAVVVYQHQSIFWHILGESKMHPSNISYNLLFNI